MPYWWTRPNPATLLSAVLRKIITFHESDPLLMRSPAQNCRTSPLNHDQKINFRCKNGQFWFDSQICKDLSPLQNNPQTEDITMNPPNTNQETQFRSENGQLRSDSPRPDWNKEAELLRLEEWALCKDILRAARSAAADMQMHPRRVSLSQIANVLLLASKLGRRACGMPIDGTPTPLDPPAPRFLNAQIEEALNRIYGPKEETDST
jgi:hypothetical protein